MNKTLTLEQLIKMPEEEKINLYKQGFELSEAYNLNDLTYTERNKNIMVLIPATCPPSLPRGATRTPSITLSTPGTPPYTYKFYVDGALKHTSPSTTATTYNGYTHTFDETAGNHTYKYEVTDSCTTGAKVASDQCTINLTECASPVATMTIPT